MLSQSLLLRCIVGLFQTFALPFGDNHRHIIIYILYADGDNSWCIFDTISCWWDGQKFCDDCDVVTIVLELTSYCLPITNYIKCARGSSIQLFIIMSSTWCGSILQVPDTNYEQAMIVIHDIWFIFCSFIVCCVLFCFFCSFLLMYGFLSKICYFILTMIYNPCRKELGTWNG